MTTKPTCPRCDAELGTGDSEGLCPACLLQQGIGVTAGDTQGMGPVAPLPIDEVARLFPNLEIIELLGAGGMGVVYKARQPQLDRFVAIKILPAGIAADPEFAERFAREARALAKLNHPNIVAVHEFGQAEGTFFFLMEYVEGVNLRELERAGDLTPEQALAIIPKVCDALQYAHDEGIVHRDVKPENILLDQKGRVKIADFGLAKLLGKPATDLTLTRTDVAMGTPKYMAPEQVEKPLTVDHRADIYSLGVVFYEMLTGELPMGRFAPPSRKVQVDVRLDEVVLKTLEKEPERRYQHASEIKDDVESLSSSPRRQAAIPQEASAARRQVRAPAIALVVTALINWLALPVVLALMAPWIQRQGPPPIPVAVVAGIILMAGSGFILWGAVRMLNLEGLGMARVAAILGMIIGPGYLLGWPAGIWALAVLSRQEVKEAFASRRTSPSRRRLAAPAVVGLITLLALFMAAPALWHWTRRSSQESPRGSMIRPGGEVLQLCAFSPSEPVLSASAIVTEDGWRIETDGAQTVRLFEITDLDVENCVLLYGADLKCRGLDGRAYLEMWCRFPGLGEFFSRGLNRSVEGTTKWQACLTPFLLKEGQRPDRVRLNLVIEGKGTVEIRRVALSRAPHG